MLRRVFLALLLLAGIAASPCRADDITHRKVRMFRVNPAMAPGDLSRPEGKSRWDLTGTRLQETFIRTVDSSEGRVTVTETSADKNRPAQIRVYSDPAGGRAAHEWFFPDRNPSKLRLGTSLDLVLEEEEK